jgi:excinuclease ABC subunit C
MRTRPCLQYQIKRCTAPCVGLISADDYKKDVEQARLFLEGKSNQVTETLIHEMETASESHAYEKAAKIRDQIALLRGTQQQQIISGMTGDVDIISIVTTPVDACIHMLMVRNGQIMGSRQFFLNIAESIIDINVNNTENANTQNSENQTALNTFLLETFLLQHYSEEKKDEFPKEILLSDLLSNKKLIETILSDRSGRQIKIDIAHRGGRAQWVKMAEESAKRALQSKVFQKTDQSARFQALQESLNLPAMPERLECFDVSHTFGQATIASCVVMDKEGPLKSEYRSFNIKTAAAGDDYEAMRESLTRRYTRLKLEGKSLPDIIIVDGGLGQMSIAQKVLVELQLVDVVLLAVAKGPLRKAGLETVYLSTNGNAVRVDLNKEAFLLIQRIRDEAHRFAITSHRKKRQKQSLHSSLEDIPGIGKLRRFQILKHFGGLQEVQKASVEDLSKVPGISQSIAQKIYEALHGS